METGRQHDADVVEELASELKELVLMLRGSTPRSIVYAKAYNARHRLGRVVANYGIGIPQKTAGESTQ